MEKIEKVYSFIMSLLDKLSNEDLIEYINNYLVMSDKLKYKDLLYKVIELDNSIDSKYRKNTKFILENINKNYFSVKRTNYIKNFFINIELNNLELASKYLDIIGCIEDIKEEHNLYKNYKKILDDRLKENGIEISNNFQETEFLSKRISTLRNNGGLVVIRPNSDGERIKIHEYIKNIPDINSETIIRDNNKSVALTYVSKFGTRNKMVLKKALNTYYEKDYEKAIILFKELIDMGYTLHYIFGNIAICYLNLGKTKSAFDYLEMAYHLAPSDERNDLYSSIINSTLFLLDKKNNREENIKKKTKITRLTDVLFLIYEEHYTIEDACKHFDLSENNINLVKLACVITEYKNSNYTKGDIILKSVEKSKDKSKFVKELFNEVRKNKLFYKNRQDLVLKFELR